MSIILNSISFLATLIVTVGAIYFILNLIIGKLEFLNKHIYNNIKVKNIVFIIVAILFLVFFTKFHLPY